MCYIYKFVLGLLQQCCKQLAETTKFHCPASKARKHRCLQIYLLLQAMRNSFMVSDSLM